MKKLLIIAVVFFLIIFLGKNFNLLNSTMYLSHDETQSSRISEFAFNLKNFKIPPRVAPHFSFSLGYPIFNYYAPFSYWVAGTIHLIGFDVVNSIKISFLIIIILAFISSFFLLSIFFSFPSALIGGSFYATSLYLAVDIFIRGNLGEAWFIALFPLAFYFLYQNKKTSSKKIFFCATFVLSMLFTSHNILSLISLPFIVIYIFLQKERRRNIISLLMSFFINAYFFIPLITETHLTYAKEVAQMTKYSDHFLCLSQLWDSKEWGFGASVPGCNDSISFKLGKIHAVLFVLGIIAFFLYRKQNNKKKMFLSVSVFFLVMTFFSLFMTTYFSQPVWNLGSFFLSYIQFPWRFIALSILGIAFFIAIFFESVSSFVLYKKYILLAIPFFIIFIQSRYFIRQPLAKKEFEQRFLTSDYIEKGAAYRIAEYLPKTVDYNYWRSLNSQDNSSIITLFNNNIPFETKNNTQTRILINTAFQKKFMISIPDILILNIHLFPFWEIRINGKKYVPTNWDMLGKPILSIKSPSIIEITYKQTLMQKIGNVISLFSVIFLLLLINKSLWKKMNR